MDNTCKICGKATDIIEHHYPQRQSPHPKIIYASMHFSDPFFGKEFALFCSPECSLVDYEAQRKEQELICIL
jgi:endogenous inhibitor of DNA gyrase (YacG/DUF329 family)